MDDENIAFTPVWIAKYFVRVLLAPSIVYSRSRSRGTNVPICCTYFTKENLFASRTLIMCIFCQDWAKIMRNKASKPENRKNKYDENMSKSTALPDMNTAHDVTSPLNSVPGRGHCFAPKSRFWQRERLSTFPLVFSKINFAMIINLFETINWPKKKMIRKFRFSSTFKRAIKGQMVMMMMTVW